VIAVDTNVVVRLLTEDDLSQAEIARSLFASEHVWLAKTVLLETCWVLKSLFGFDERAVRTALAKLLGLENVSIEDEVGVSAALLLADAGVELADALHFASSPPAATFATFDRTFVRRAQSAGVTNIVGLNAPATRARRS
jgi:predicted nucleic-acid-binding protein